MDSTSAHPWAGQQLLLPSIRAGTSDLFLVSLDTGNACNLTLNQAENRFPAWSPDGKSVVFSSTLDGSLNLFTIAANGKDLRQLTHERAPTVCFLPTWSSDGRIAFGRDRGTDGVEIVVMNADGSEPTLVGQGTDPCLSPDGSAIAFTQKGVNGYCVCTMASDGANPCQITTQKNQIGAVVPTWSPDGSLLLYSAQVENGLEVFVCDARTGTSKQLTQLGKISTSPAWSPDGNWISFRVTDTPFWQDPITRQEALRHRDTLRPVYLMRADGTDLDVISSLRYQCAPDGSRAAWRPRTVQP